MCIRDRHKVHQTHAPELQADLGCKAAAVVVGIALGVAVSEDAADHRPQQDQHGHHAHQAEQHEVAHLSLIHIYTALSAYAFMIFNLLCAPCFAAMGAIKREMNNGKWTAIAIGYMLSLIHIFRDWKDALACFFAHWDGENGMKG